MRGQTNKLIPSKRPAEYRAGIVPERLAGQGIPDDPGSRSPGRFPEFLAARGHPVANALNRLPGLPDRTGRATRREPDEPPADGEVIAGETNAPAPARG